MGRPRRRSANKQPQHDDRGERLLAFMRHRITNPDKRTHTEFLADMRAKQAAGLTNPATDALIDRLARAIPSARPSTWTTPAAVSPRSVTAAPAPQAAPAAPDSAPTAEHTWTPDDERNRMRHRAALAAHPTLRRTTP